MSHLGKPLGEVLLNDASHRYWGDVSASVLNLSLSSQGQEKIWCFFSISINSDDITSPPSLLWWDDISNLGSISSRTNWHWFFFFFFFFLAPFLRTQQIHKAKEAIILWLKTCWDGFSVPTGRTWGSQTAVLLCAACSCAGAGLGSLLSVCCRHAYVLTGVCVPFDFQSCRLVWFKIDKSWIEF